MAADEGHDERDRGDAPESPRATDDRSEGRMSQAEGEGGIRSFVAGLLIGALVGAGVALLFAPQSGADTRRVIRRRAKQLAGEAQDRYEDLTDRVRHSRRRRERDEATAD
ncbi:MAG: YtxH domain-containing protein [Gemmatimonadetes bacterium]|nr:YtxH domain-containing protein [Gemmatimonadota bacterium]